MTIQMIHFIIILTLVGLATSCGRAQLSEEIPIEDQESYQGEKETDQDTQKGGNDEWFDKDANQIDADDSNNPSESKDKKDSGLDGTVVGPSGGGFIPPQGGGSIIPPPNIGPPPASQGRWKLLLFTGDNSINAFDNARQTLAQIFRSKGIDPRDTAQLSMNSSYQGGGVMPTSKTNLQSALRQNSPGPSDGCIIHMTSHGSRSGFYLKGQSTLSPAEFDSMVGSSCGSRPTIILVSACYSGVFIEGMQNSPNRIILTAARPDRTSFGCGAENQYTYWDGCLIDNLQHSQTWNQLYGNVKSCIERKESGGGFSSSGPQGFFGSQMNNIPIAGGMPF